MDAHQSHMRLKARFVLPVAGPPIADGFVEIAGSEIVAVGPARAGVAVHDLGNVAILPGLVNAHTHLEFSDLAAPLGLPGMPLPDWIRQVIATRRGVVGDRSQTIARGLRECLSHGTTTVGEIATFDWRAKPEPTHATMPDVVMFHELIAPRDERIAPAIAAAEAFLSMHSVGTNILAGLSPHAPYTVTPELIRRSVALSRQFQVPVAMHLAESREELKLLRTGAGPFVDLLRDLDAWNPSANARLPRIHDYLALLAQAPRSLAIHGNYLDAAEIDLLASYADRMSVVYCPRTHAFFRHEPYPLMEFLARGVNVALGTDSRASNPDLDLLAEMRFVRRGHPSVPASAVLELGTLAGAKALGLDNRLGTLAPGKQADFAVVSLGGSAGDDPHERLFAPGAKVVETWKNGQVAFDASV